MYTEKLFHQFGTDLISIATTGDKAGIAFSAIPVFIIRLAYSVRVANTGAAVIAFDKIQSFGGPRGNGDVGTLAIPANPVLGTVYYKDVSIRMLPGDTVVAEVTTAGAAGSGHIACYSYFDHNVPANFSAMIASA